MFRESFRYATAIFAWINRIFYRFPLGLCKKQIGGYLESSSIRSRNLTFGNNLNDLVGGPKWCLPSLTAQDPDVIAL
jgi:hypothetical protein